MAVEFTSLWNWTYTGPRCWDDIGAEEEWPDDADPMSPDVARALVYAAMERAEAVRAAHGDNGPMRVLRGAVAQCGPWEVPRLDAYNAVREAIRLMFGRFIDWDLTWQAYQDAWANYDYTDPHAAHPTTSVAPLDYTAECRAHPGLRIIGSAGSPRMQLALFCAGAYDALRRMRFVQFSGDNLRDTRTDWTAYATGANMMEARANALADEQEQTSQFPQQMTAVSAGFVLPGDAEYYRVRCRSEIHTDPLYTTSPVDGGPLRPGLRLLTECTNYWIQLESIQPYGGAYTYSCPLGWPQGPGWTDYPASDTPLELVAQVDSVPGHAEDGDGHVVVDGSGFTADLTKLADYCAADETEGFLFKSYPDPDEDQSAESESDND